MYRRAIKAIGMLFGVLIASASPGFAQSCAAPCQAGGAGPAVVIEAPVPQAGALNRDVPFDAADQPTALPEVGIAAGLLLLGVTLTRISLRRRAALAVDLGPVGETLVLRGAQTYVSGTPSSAPVPSSATRR